MLSAHPCPVNLPLVALLSGIRAIRDSFRCAHGCDTYTIERGNRPLPQMPPACALPGSRCSREASCVSRVDLLGQTCAGLRRPARCPSDPGTRSRRPRRQSHRKDVHWRSLRRFPLQSPTRRGLCEPTNFYQPRRWAGAQQRLHIGHTPVLAAREQAASIGTGKLQAVFREGTEADPAVRRARSGCELLCARIWIF